MQTPRYDAQIACLLAFLLGLSHLVAAGQTVPPSHPDNPEYWYNKAKDYSDKSKAANLSRRAAETLVLRALEADDRALLLNPVYYEALILKDALLRERARFEKDSAVRRKLIAEADAIKVKVAKMKAGIHSTLW